MLRKSVLALSFLLALGIISAISMLSIRDRKISKGYCFAQNRYISESELVDKGISALIEEIVSDPALSDETLLSRSDQFKDVSSFREKNPSCCRPLWEKANDSDRVGVSKKLIYTDKGSVLAGAIFFQTNHAEGPSLRQMASYDVTLCGEVIAISIE